MSVSPPVLLTGLSSPLAPTVILTYATSRAGGSAVSVGGSTGGRQHLSEGPCQVCSKASSPVSCQQVHMAHDGTQLGCVVTYTMLLN